jgi:hypothetical protein
VLCGVGMRGRGNFVSCMLTRIGDNGVVLRLGRRCAKTCRHTFESDWMGLESGRVGQFASEGELLRGKVRPDAHVGELGLRLPWSSEVEHAARVGAGC